MRFYYLGSYFDVELLSHLNDYGHILEQILAITDWVDGEIIYRHSIVHAKGRHTPHWRSPQEAMREIFGAYGGIISRIKRRIRVRKIAKHLRPDIVGASCNSLRKALREQGVIEL